MTFTNDGRMFQVVVAKIRPESTTNTMPIISAARPMAFPLERTGVLGPGSACTGPVPSAGFGENDGCISVPDACGARYPTPGPDTADMAPSLDTGIPDGVPDSPRPGISDDALSGAGTSGTGCQFCLKGSPGGIVRVRGSSMTCTPPRCIFSISLIFCL